MNLPICQFRFSTTDPERFICTHSRVHAKGDVVPVSLCGSCDERHKPCPNPRPAPQGITAIPVSTASSSLAGRAFSFTIAAIKHVVAGMPTCTQEQIDDRLAICRGTETLAKCSSFNGIGCNECGCNCSDSATFLNKLAWADQECPLKKWLAIKTR